MSKTIQEINERIKKGKAVVVTAEEIIELADKKGIKKAAQEVDVVTTGTFGPMCSSAAYLNFGHSKPRIKIGGGTAFLNNVPAYAGFPVPSRVNCQCHMSHGISLPFLQTCSALLDHRRDTSGSALTRTPGSHTLP